MIAKAWAAWKVRHKDRIGPGPGFIEAMEAALSWNDVSYGYDETRHKILLPHGAPFDGREYLLKTKTGVVSGHWDMGGWTEDTPISPAEYEGWCWVCLDDQFQLELDDVTQWMEMI
jgi:hypothetical protein